jgi:hypothetical protein
VASRKQRAAGGAVVVVAGALVYLNKAGKAPSISLTAQSTSQSFSPFVFWMHQDPMGYFHQFPATVGANCLPQPYATEDMGQALKQVEVERIDNAGCAQ